MDIVTHGLASLAVTRSFFPRSGRAATAFAVVTGVAADVDWMSAYFGPSSFLNWHRTYLHSVTLALIASALLPASLLAGLLWGGLGFELPKGVEVPASPASLRNLILRNYLPPLGSVAAVSVFTALLHIAMDACQSDGVMLLWPFSSRRFALDWLPGLDPWILTILVACIAVPELLHLISSEIGAREKKPRGQTGALIGLALVLVYIGVRATLHTNVVAALESRSFHGEPARHASAFPESLSLLTWQGIAETENALNQIEVNAASTSALDADNSARLFKPQNSPALEAARNTSAAKRFLAIAEIPKASVEKREAGYVVVIRDLRYAASGETDHEMAALIALDLNNQVTSAELVWARDLHQLFLVPASPW